MSFKGLIIIMLKLNTSSRKKNFLLRTKFNKVKQNQISRTKKFIGLKKPK